MKRRWVNTNNPHLVLLDTLSTSLILPSEQQSAGTADALCTVCSIGHAGDAQEQMESAVDLGSGPVCVNGTDPGSTGGGRQSRNALSQPREVTVLPVPAALKPEPVPPPCPAEPPLALLALLFLSSSSSLSAIPEPQHPAMGPGCHPAP